MAIYFNSRTLEPYLRLSDPHSNIILTPYRLDQSQLEETYAVLVKWLNDPRVYPWLEGPPYPYLREHAREYIKTVSEETKPVLDAVRAEHTNSLSGTIKPQTQQFHGTCPFQCIREVIHQDPETNDPLRDILIGNIGVSRYSFYEYQSGTGEREEAMQRNNVLSVGDESIVWGLGCESTHPQFTLLSGFVTSIADESNCRFSGALAPWKGHHDPCYQYTDPRLGGAANECAGFEGFCLCREWR